MLERKKSSHIRTNCPLLKSSKKAMKTTWNDNDESGNEEEVPNFCSWLTRGNS